jgi:hypothetical protein
MTPRRTFGTSLLGVLLASPASAQPGAGKQKVPNRGPLSGRGGRLRIPVLLDLRKVPVGSWAEYAVSQGGRMPRVVRQALVGRDQTSATVEVIMTKGNPAQLGPNSRRVTTMVMDLDVKELAPRKRIVQRGDTAPMECPGRERFYKPDPKKSLGSQALKVPAGTFNTQHFQDTSPRGGAIDIWASTQVPPFGLVRLERKPGANAPAERAGYGHVTYQLVRTGTGATPSITKPAQPLNPSTLRSRRRSPNP